MMTTTINHQSVNEKAADLAAKLKALPALTSQADGIARLSTADQADPDELRHALLEQCRELTALKERYADRSRKVLSELADKCFDLAIQVS